MLGYQNSAAGPYPDCAMLWLTPFSFAFPSFLSCSVIPAEAGIHPRTMASSPHCPPNNGR